MEYYVTMEVFIKSVEDSMEYTQDSVLEVYEVAYAKFKCI